MSRPKVPEGKTDYYTTRQKEATDKGYVGYDILWKTLQKEAAYTIPKQP